MYKAAGYQDVDVAMVWAVRCAPKRGADPSMQQLRTCRPFFLRAIQLLQPQLLLGFGATALRALTNSGDGSVTKQRGIPLLISFVNTDGVAGNLSQQQSVAYVTYSPKGVLEGAAHLEQRIVDDLRRPDLPSNPWPELVSSDSDLGPASFVSVDTEWDARGALLTIGLATSKRAVAYEEGEFAAVGRTLAGADHVGGHNVPDDLLQVLNAGLPVREAWLRGIDVHDSLTSAKMVDENDVSYELQTKLLSFCNSPPWKQLTEPLWAKYKDFGQIPSDLRRQRCALDAWSAGQILRHYHPQLSSVRPLVEFTNRIAATLSRISLAGAFIDTARLEAIGADLQSTMIATRDVLTKTALAAGMTTFSPTNDNHIRELLFERFNLPVLSKTAGSRQASVDRPTLLQHLDSGATIRSLDDGATESGDAGVSGAASAGDCIRTLLAYNKADKQHSVNVEGLSSLLRPAGYIAGIHAAYLPFRIASLGAKTGRRASSAPNSQNWPEVIRGIVRSRWPGGYILDADYSGLEMVIIGWVSGEEKLIEYFINGSGYLDIAKEILGYDVKKATPEYRAIKSIVLGVDYNMQKKKMAKQLWLMITDETPQGVRFSADYAEHERITDQHRRKYLRIFNRVAEYIDGRETEVLRTNQVVSRTGRIRHLPLPDGRDTPGYGHTLNQAINFPIQSLASDITGSAMIDIEAELLRLHGLTYTDYTLALLEARRKVLTTGLSHDIMYPLNMPLIFNEVHDDIVVDIPPGQETQTRELVVETMRNVPSLKAILPGFDMPLKVGVKLAPFWGENG